MANLLKKHVTGGADTDSFKIDITTIGASESFTFPFYNGGTYTNCTIDFGDGGGALPIAVYNDANATNIYATADTYTITVSADRCGGIYVNNVAPYDLRFDEITQWGTIPFDYLQFRGAENMIVTATDVPDLTNVTTFLFLFLGCYALTTIPNLDSWNTTGITNMQSAFNGCLLFNSDCGSWDVSAVTTFDNMFNNCRVFDQDLGGWTLKSSGTISLKETFQNCWVFNQDLDSWNTTYVTTMYETFRGCKLFNQPVNSWDTSGVTTMFAMFLGCTVFNQPVSNFDFTAMTTIQAMFQSCPAFNQSVATVGSKWDISGLTTLASVFNSCTAFNQDLSSWVTSGITNFSSCFYNCANFNGDITGWNVSAGINFVNMLYICPAFNQNISSWTFKASGTINMQNMLRQMSIFNQDLSGWNIQYVNVFNSFMLSSNALSTANYDLILVAWDAQTLTSGNTIHFGDALYTKTEVDNGQADGTTANKLVDSTQNFVTTVSINDIVHNTTDRTYAKVTAIDSDTTLSLNADIMISGENYQIETSNAVKAKENMINSDSWAITDSGGV